MPVFVGSTPVVQPPTPTPVVRLDRSSLSLHTTSGVFEMSAGDPYLLLPGATGMEAPPVTLYGDSLPQGDGSVYRGIHVNDVQMNLPIAVFGRDEIEVRDNVRGLTAALFPTRGSFEARMSHASGESRSRWGFYTGGFEGDWGVDTAGRCFRTYALGIRCMDPAWYGADAVVANFASADVTSRPFLSADNTYPFTSFVLSQAHIVGNDVPITNPGDLSAYPKWTIMGPATEVTVTLVETGESFSLASGLASGESLIIDCTPTLAKPITDQDGANLWPKLASGSKLWALPPGTNHVDLTLNGSDDTTNVSVTLRPRYVQV